MPVKKNVQLWKGCFRSVFRRRSARWRGGRLRGDSPNFLRAAASSVGDSDARRREIPAQLAAAVLRRRESCLPNIAFVKVQKCFFADGRGAYKSLEISTYRYHKNFNFFEFFYQNTASDSDLMQKTVGSCWDFCKQKQMFCEESSSRTPYASAIISPLTSDSQSMKRGVK